MLILLLTVIFGVGLFAGWQFSRTSATAESSATVHTTATVQATSTVETAQEAAIAKVKAAVVEVDVTTQSARALGSGVIIDQRGYIVTNNHVVTGAQSIEVVLSDGTHLSAQLVGSDSADDLAVLKITNSNQDVLIKWQHLAYRDHWRADGPGDAAHGDRRARHRWPGALIDLQGNLIGIPTLGAIDTEFNTPANGVGFAIPSNTVAAVVSQLIATGHV